MGTIAAYPGDPLASTRSRGATVCHCDPCQGQRVRSLFAIQQGGNDREAGKERREECWGRGAIVGGKEMLLL